MDNIKDMNKEELYNYLLKYILNVYDSYLFLLFDSNKLKSMLIDRLYERRLELNVNNIKEVINEEFENITLEESQKDNLKIIENYTKVYKTKNNIRDIVNYLRSFEEFLEFINISDNEDIIFKVVKDNKIINNLLEIVVNSIISDSKYRYIKNNPKLESLISIYCIINNIDIDNFEEEKEETYSTYDVNDLYRNGELDTERLYSVEIRRIPRLTYQEEIELGRKIQEGSKEALDKLVEHNLRLADKIAHKYVNNGLDLDDLRQIANEGLFKAATKYNPNLGYKFSTYATWWIRQAITRAFENEKQTIRIASQSMNYYKKYSKLKDELWSKLGHEPNSYEMHIEYDMDYDYISLMESINNINSISSLDKKINLFNSDTPVSIMEIIEDRSIPDVNNFNLFEELFKGLNVTKREKDIILRRYKYGETGEEVATRYGITRQRVEQIERRILGNPKKIKELDVYREELGINKSYYISDMDKLNILAKKIVNKLKSKELSNINLFTKLNLTLMEKLYFILRYGFQMENRDIYKYNIIDRLYCNTVNKKIINRINNSKENEELLCYINNPLKIIEELDIIDIYNEFLSLIEESFNRGSIKEKIDFRVNYYFNRNISRFIFILKESKFKKGIIKYFILKYVLEIQVNDFRLNNLIKKYIEESSYKDEIVNYLNNKELILEELKLSSKTLVK